MTKHVEEFTTYAFGNTPSAVPLAEGEYSRQLVGAAGFNPYDEEVTVSALTEDWSGHPAGSRVVHGASVEGHKFVVGPPAFDATVVIATGADYWGGGTDEQRERWSEALASAVRAEFPGVKTMLRPNIECGERGYDLERVNQWVEENWQEFYDDKD